jgi:replicative DNA helicase
MSDPRSLAASKFADPQLERHLLGCLLYDSSFVPHIDPEIFYKEANRRIFAAMVDMVTAGKELSLPVLVSIVPDLAASYVSSLLDGVIRLSKTDIEAVVDQLTLLKSKRKVYILSHAIQDALKRDEFEKVDELLDEIKYEQTPKDSEKGSTIGNILEEYEQYLKKGEGIKCGIPSLDRLTNGLGEGEVLYLMARAKVAKSAFAQNWIHYFVNTYPQYGAAFYSLEMPPAQLAERLLMIDLNKTKEEIKRLQPEDKEEVLQRHQNIYYVTHPSMTLGDIYRSITRLKFKTDVRLVVIDFLTRISTHIDDEYNFIRKATARLKDVAKELRVAVAVLAQVGRESGAGGWKPLTLQSGRGSGTIEEDGDIILGMYRPELDPYITPADHERWRNIIALQVLGSRRTDTVNLIKLYFNKYTLRITEIEQEAPHGATNQPSQ